MASFRQNIKIFNEIAKKQGWVHAKPVSLPRDGRCFTTARARTSMLRSYSWTRGDDTLVKTNIKKYSSLLINNFPTLLSNANAMKLTAPSRNFSDKKCQSPCPKKKKPKKVSLCRKSKSCSELPKELCLCNPPRHLPRPPKKTSALICPPKEHEKIRSCTSIKIPLAGCVLPKSTSCVKYVKRPKCEKREAPVPSYSECIKEPTPPRKPTECSLSESMRYLQPANRILNPTSTEKMLPEVDLLLDPCMGECCKRVDLAGRPACPDKASSARLQCLPIGVPVALPGCAKPVDFDCTRVVRREKCKKPLAPFPSFSECKKDRLKQLKYRECNVATKRTRAFAEMRSLNLPITVKTIEEGRCVREGVEWNCDVNGRKGFFCKPTGTILECSTLSLKERQLISEQKCKNPRKPCNDY